MPKKARNLKVPLDLKRIGSMCGVMVPDPKDTVQRLFAEITAQLEDAAAAAIEGQSPWVTAKSARETAETVRATLEGVGRRLDSAEMLAVRYLGDLDS